MIHKAQSAVTDASPTASPQRPLPPLRKQWFDKLADAILGDDDSAGTGAASRYALICQKCFAHNGLVKESLWEDARQCPLSPLMQMVVDRAAEYVCPKCGYFNPSARALRDIKKSRSPDGRVPQPPSQAAGHGNFAPSVGVPSGTAAGPAPDTDGTSMDIDT